LLNTGSLSNGIIHSIDGVIVGQTTSAGLAVTGTLSTTGTLSGGTSGTGYSFSGSAPATSLTLNASGNLGIGTSTPLVKFDVKGTTDTHVGIDASGIDEVIIVAFDDSGIRTPNLSYAAASHKFLINTTERMRLDATGLAVTGALSATTNINSTRINPRATSAASTATLTPDISSFDQNSLTARAVGLTVAAPTGTPLDGNKLILRILDNGTSQTITWNATYTVIGTTLPTATTINKMIYVGCIYNAANTRWDVIAVTTQA
jgi:hypothetical protein